MLWSGKTRLGRFFTHYASRCIHVDVVIECVIIEPFVESLLEEISNFYGNPESDKDGNDLIITFYEAKELASYSGSYDHSDALATATDLHEVKQQISRYSGKHERIFGQLNQAVAREYFEHVGYAVSKSTPVEDSQKIDLVASKEGSDIYIQVKSGDIGYSVISNCCSAINEVAASNGHPYRIAFVGKSFPPDFDFRREKFEFETGCKLIVVSSDDVCRILPEFKHSLS